MLGNTNIVALVGAGETPDFSQKKLILWDTKNEKKVCELYYDDEKILNVKLDYSMYNSLISNETYILGLLWLLAIIALCIVSLN